ncbi:MAG: hypothetical protein NUV78_01915 [Candidatus Zambryskibacteria bacterium]|nr:hypothetical protein [Candidatus Zambryskibacteria bacterium]
MAKTESQTEFFESIVEDPNIPETQFVLFFSMAYAENDGDPDAQLRLLDLAQKHRPALEGKIARVVIRGR